MGTMCRYGTIAVKPFCVSRANDKALAGEHLVCMRGTKRTFIREWRKHRRLTLEKLAERVGITHGNLSRIERGLRPYGQPLLEALAEELRTDPASLLMRNPLDPEGLWSIWDQIPPTERPRAIEVLRAFTRTGTDG